MLYGSAAEYALHCALFLVGVKGERPLSTRALARYQGISPTFVAKLFTRLEKAGIVRAAEGARGGFRLVRRPHEITVLDIVDAAEGRKRLFDCKDVRLRCILFQEEPPSWASRGVCDIHAIMLQAEKAMREQLSSVTLAELAARVGSKVPAGFAAETRTWFERPSDGPWKREHDEQE